MLNMNSLGLDELAARIGKAIESSPARDIEKTIKSLLASGLSRLDLVTREEYDVQAQVLLRTREKLERMEARVAELEARFPPMATTGAGLQPGPGGPIPMGAGPGPALGPLGMPEPGSGASGASAVGGAPGSAPVGDLPPGGTAPRPGPTPGSVSDPPF